MDEEDYISKGRVSGEYSSKGIIDCSGCGSVVVPHESQGRAEIRLERSFIADRMVSRAAIRSK